MERATAWLLIVGAVVFWIAAVTPPYRQWMGPPVKEPMGGHSGQERRTRVVGTPFPVQNLPPEPGQKWLNFSPWVAKNPEKPRKNACFVP